MTGLLVGEGREVVVAKNGVQGLAVAEKVVPNLIILDIGLPDIDGFDVLQRLKSNPLTSPIPIVAISAHANVVEEEDKVVISKQFAAMFAKPLDIGVFLAKIGDIMRGGSKQEDALPTKPAPIEL